jgi:hypothetical protein
MMQEKYEKSHESRVTSQVTTTTTNLHESSSRLPNKVQSAQQCLSRQGKQLLTQLVRSLPPR